MVSDYLSPVFTEGQMIVQNVFQTVSAEVTGLQDVLDIVGMTGLQDVQALLCCLQNMWASLCGLPDMQALFCGFALQDMGASLCGLHCKTYGHRSVVCKIRGLTLWSAKHAGITLWFARQGTSLSGLQDTQASLCGL